MLDARLQSAGGAGQARWEPCSQIGVYIWNSTFHAGSVAILWNPTTGRVSPQYHVVFDNDFTTVPYMESSTLPPNWEDLVKYYSELTTIKDVYLEETWLNDTSAAGATDQLSDPFSIVTDHMKRPRTDTPGSQDSSPSSNIHTSISDGDKSHVMIST